MVERNASPQCALDGSAAGKRPTLHDWLAKLKGDAERRGGKPWSKTNLSRMVDDRGPAHIVARRPGEFANPITGEVVTDCLTIGRLAAELGLTSAQLTDHMERLHIVCRVLDYREVPMVCAPWLRKPRYFSSPVVTARGVADGLAVSITTQCEGGDRELILVTSDGQRALRLALGSGKKQGRKVDAKRELIASLLRQGHTQAAIVRLTSLPKQTVSRHVRALQVDF